MFALSLALVSGLFLFKVANLEKIMFWLFLAGNALYYISGIALAFIFKDNLHSANISALSQYF